MNATEPEVCRHGSETAVEHMPRGNIHFAKVICLDCGRFLRWLPKPKPTAGEFLDVLGRLVALIPQSRRRHADLIVGDVLLLWRRR